MKKIWRKLPSLVRWALVTIMILALTGGAVYAYVALTATGDVTVEECLSWVGDNTFSVTLYPQESQIEALTLANASSQDMEVDFLSTIIPDPGSGMTIDIPNKVTVPGDGQVSFDITISAGKSVAPNSYSVSIEVVR